MAAESEAEKEELEQSALSLAEPIETEQDRRRPISLAARVASVLSALPWIGLVWVTLSSSRDFPEPASVTVRSMALPMLLLSAHLIGAFRSIP